MSSRRGIGLALALLYIASFLGGGIAHALQLSERCACEQSSNEGESWGRPLPKDHDLSAHGDDCSICRVLCHARNLPLLTLIDLSRQPQGTRPAQTTPPTRSEIFANLHSPRGPPQLFS